MKKENEDPHKNSFVDISNILQAKIFNKIV